MERLGVTHFPVSCPSDIYRSLAEAKICRFGELYCVAQDEVVVFDFVSGKCLGAVVRLPGLNGQAVIFFG